MTWMFVGPIPSVCTLAADIERMLLLTASMLAGGTESAAGGFGSQAELWAFYE